MPSQKKLRVLLKLSGESLSDTSASISASALKRTISEIKSAAGKNTQFAIVVGAGNIWRGAGKSAERVTADKMGMLATAMNALALGDALKKAGVKAKVFSAAEVTGFAEAFNKNKAIAALNKGCVVVFGGGTGKPFFTTDTASALRAVEINADILLKATQVDGVYSADPKKDKKAVKFSKLSFKEALAKKLKIMDSEAFSMCQDSGISIIVFDFYKNGNLKKAVAGKKIGTIVTK